MEPETFGRYQLLAKLGRGGMAEVFLAVAAGPAGFRKLVVIKRLHEHLQSDPEIVEMFLDEARIAARLNHPNVVQTYEVGRVGECHFIAMEYLQGVSLDRLLVAYQERHESLPPQVAASILIDVLDALHHVHELRDFDGSPLHVVHRDVSPHNLFVAWDGTVKLIDFGIVKADRSTVESSPGTIKGKSSYISPEQAMGKDVDRRADVWSSGVVLWELLAGKRLFKSINEVATLREALSARIPPLRELVEGTPPELDAIVQLALQRERDHRYGSALDMKEDLEGFLRSAGLAPSRSAIAEVLETRLGAERERQRGVLQVCLGGDRLVASAGSASLAAPPEMPASSSTSLPALATGRRVAWAGVAALAIVSAVTVYFVWPTLQPSLVEREPAPAPIIPAPIAPIAAPAAVEPTPAPVAPAITAAPEELAPPEDALPHRRDRGRHRNLATPTAVSQAVQDVVDAGTAAQVGYLSLDSSPWSIVTLEGRELGTTPLIRVPLPAGRHVLRLRNPELGMETEYRVEIQADRATARRIGLAESP